MPTESGNLATESMVPLIPCPENWMNATAAALRLESAASALAELAVVIPAEHAARDRQAAAAARAAAAFRYIVTALNLGRRLARRSRGPGPRATRVVRLICFDACRIRVPGA